MRPRSPCWLPTEVRERTLHCCPLYYTDHSSPCSTRVLLIHVPASQSASVSLAPLRFGAGIKGKILDSWHWGLPVVSTVIGSEGLSWLDGNGGGEIGSRSCSDSDVGEGSVTLSQWGGIGDIDNEDAFVAGAVRLYREERLWNDCQHKVG